MLCGDGGFQMTGPEISHAPAFGANPIVIVDQQRRMGHLPAGCDERRELLDIPPWPYAQLARDWGGAGFEAHNVEPNCASALEAAHRRHQSFAIIDVKVERDDLSPVTVKYIKAAAEALAGAARRAPQQRQPSRPLALLIRAEQSPPIERSIANPYRDFRWETPEYFNFGATIDKFAADPGRVAILWEDQRRQPRAR